MNQAQRECIYCSASARSVEHPLPRALGEFQNAPLLEERLCHSCNQKLGRLDEQLARSGPEGFLRRFFAVAGRAHHESVNVFERGSAGGSRIEMKAHDDALGVDVLLEVENGAARQMRQLILIDAARKHHHLPIRRDDTPERLRKNVEGLGAAVPFGEARLLADPQELEWIEPLLKAAWPKAQFGQTTVGGTQFKGATIDVRLTDRYFRALAKIGFHFFLTQFSEYAGCEPEFAAIRQFIEAGVPKVTGVNSFVGIRDIPLLYEMLAPNVRPNSWRGHLVCAEIRPTECRAYAQLFLSQEWPALIYAIRISNSGHFGTPRAAGYSYIYFANGQEGKFAGAANELSVRRTDVDSPLRPAVEPREPGAQSA